MWQVIAPLLIIKRVANQSALTSSTVVTGPNVSFHVGSRMESTRDSCVLPGGHPTCPSDKHEGGSGEIGLEVETTIDFHRDSKV